ncbi:MAG: GH92 family glycosyl hydrolase, partial [Bacteroidales bacterium]|nr:GH92 family glycosyl hydrolase [Bacteroidales bacterium]
MKKAIMRRLLFPISLTAVFTAGLVYLLFFYQQSEQIVEPRSAQVDPLIGTDFHGHTHPAATLPFGMVQLGPDTRLDGWDGCSAFHYSDSVIYGFSHTHLSGTGCSDYGDILLMPFTKYNPKPEVYEYTSLYNHKTVTATPGFYSVMLDDYNTKVELTVSPRVGFHKYSFPDASERYVLLDLQHRDEVIETYITQLSETRFVGLRRSRAWAEDQILYFVADFSEPVSIIDYQSDLMNKKGDEFLEIDTADSNEKLPVYYCGKNNKIIIKPLSDKNTELLVKVGLSATGEEGAIKNLEAEIPNWDFEKVKKDTALAWDHELSKIRVYGGSEDAQTIFYTSLYHTFSAPNIYSDVDGSFRGTDLKVHTNPGHDTYTVFSLWDTFRATHPLYTLIQQKRTLDFIKTFLDHYKYGGMLPVWELSGNETYCMIGYHSVPVIVDAYFKGIRDFDHNLALKAMTSTAKTDELGKAEFAEYGYIPLDKEHESVSKTLEYAFDDWCIAMYARDLGKTDIYNEFIERSQFYKNIFNPENGFMQAKLNGAWQTPFDPREVNYNFTEANSWQYSFFVPHDILTFIELHGGNEKFAAQLDLMF